jgi:hypothetical protein
MPAAAAAAAGPGRAAARAGWLDRSLKELLEDELYRAWLTRGALVVAVAAGIYGVAFLYVRCSLLRRCPLV